MADATLVLKANNSDYVNKMREAQRESQKVYDIVQQGEKREKGILQEIEEKLNSLERARKKAFSYEEISKYNLKIAEAKKDLQEYEQAGLKADNQTQSLTQTIGKWALGLGGAAAILGTLKKALMETVTGIDAFNIAGAATKQVLNDIVTGAGFSIDRIRAAIQVQRELNAMRLESAVVTFKAAVHMNAYQKLYVEALDKDASNSERLEKINAALAEHDKAIDIEIEHKKKQIIETKRLIELQPQNEKMILQYGQFMTDLINLDAQRVRETKRLQVARFAILKENKDNEQKLHDDAIKKWHDEIEDENKTQDEANKKRLDMQKKFQDLSLKLLDEYDKSNIESLTGVKKLEAQRDFALKQIAAFRKQLAELGKVTEEQDAIFTALGENVWKTFMKGMEKEGKVSAAQKKAISGALLGGIEITERDQEDIVTKLVGAKQDISKKLAGAPVFTKSTKPKTSIWELFGIDPESEDGKKEIDALNKVWESTINTLDDIYQKRVDDATRTRELAESKINDVQHELEIELQLNKQGFASNSAKQKELNDLKKQRDKAAEDEAKAVKAQRTLDTITQTSSLITASAQTLKSFPGPLLPIALIAIAAMFTAFIAAKSKAANMTKLSEGATGTVTGRSHAQGGERFLDHIEVEEGERWGVLSRKASAKYGNVFNYMVNSFNRDKLPIPRDKSMINNVIVQNEGPNKRLDQVNANLQKLSRNKEEITETGSHTIIRKGNSTRIIRK